MPRIVFLTRGDASHGMGHLHRVSWLAAALLSQRRDNLAISVQCLDSPQAWGFFAPHSPFVQTLRPLALAATDVTFHESADLMLSGLAAGDVVVVDWLDSPEEFATAARAIVAPDTPAPGTKPGALVLLDDYGPARQQAALCINALLAPLEDSDSTANGTRVLSGAAYVQLPLSALRLRGVGQAKAKEAATLLSGPAPKVGPVRMVLVSFGGSPKPELIHLALNSLRLAGFNGKVIVMPAPVGGELPAPTDASLSLDVEYHPAGDEFHDYMAGADLAILAGGLSLYEAAFFGVPAICVPLVEHQQSTALKLERASCCRLAGMAGKVNAGQLAVKLKGLLGSARLRGRMSYHGMRLIDGRGLQRTADAILDLL